MIVVIADDITGAAEIAGIGYRYGLKITFLTGENNKISPCDLLVYATDTRSMDKNEAVKEILHVINYLKTQLGKFSLFKKTDSALRGHITPEMEVLMKEMGYSCTLFLPENPSKGRIVKNGIYFINNIPLEKTSFLYDPEFPANTSLVTQRIPGIRSLGISDILPENGICIADATNQKEINQQLKKAHDNVLIAGAADLFTAYLQQLGYSLKRNTPFEGLNSHDALIVCGSTVSNSLESYPYVQRKQIKTARMPLSVFEGAPADMWITETKTDYSSKHSYIVTIDHPAKKGKEYAIRLRSIIANLASEMLSAYLPEELIIEGGATAFALLKKLNWHEFDITNEIAPGVVRMIYKKEKHPIYITLKPGSYSWETFFK